jgi:3-deoxy-manno-octulosonate cytidylyltransferase (CMP-KDO synthetase)
MRLASTRLPGKVLRPIAGVPMLGWVYRAARACPQLDQVLIATDSQEVVAYADSEGWPSIMTSAALSSGTDRVHAVAMVVDADVYVNIQGTNRCFGRNTSMRCSGPSPGPMPRSPRFQPLRT